MRSAPRLWTLGHSTRPLEALLDMLAEAGIAVVADVRRYPGSRRNPQYAAEALAGGLGGAGIDYLPMPELGGRRAPRAGSPHTAWRNAGFRGYADYMDTPAYAAARERLQATAQDRPTAVLCAEAMWWSCHRSLIADDFKARGWEVMHLMAPGKAQVHPYTAAARIVDGRLDYASPAGDQGALFPG